MTSKEHDKIYDTAVKNTVKCVLEIIDEVMADPMILDESKVNSVRNRVEMWLLPREEKGLKNVEKKESVVELLERNKERIMQRTEQRQDKEAHKHVEEAIV